MPPSELAFANPSTQTPSLASKTLHQLDFSAIAPSLTTTTAQNFDEYDSNDEGQDGETSAYLDREIEKAEADNHPQGKPGTLLNRMISHGNKKTEEQIAREGTTSAAGQNSAGVQNV